MPEAQNVIDVTDLNFEQEVIARSHQVPVVVDFWAPWCGPCRALGPTLESLAGKSGGEWILAKVNVDDNQESARRYGVRGIPAVKAFENGEIVDEFTGALPQSQIEQWLDGFLPSEVDEKLDQADAFVDQGDLDRAAALYKEVLEAEPDDPDALLGMAKVAAGEGNHAEAERLLESVPPAERDADYEQISLELEASRLAPVEKLEARVSDDPGDLEALYELGVRLAAAGKFDEALEHLLQIVIRDRTFRDDVGRETMVRIFQLMGPDSDRVREWQKKLGRAMY